MQPDIALYGACIEENGRYRLVISGAAALDSTAGKVQHFNDAYFPTCTYIGSAYISRNKDNQLRLELTFNNTQVILDDFYIFYDQNEEMQNYLIEWNLNKDKGRNVGNAEQMQSGLLTEQEVRRGSNATDVAKLGRIAQAYNREEAKVSFMWNVMNFLCFGFIVCVMAYGIISINNYNKMQDMQASIDYCLAYVTEDRSHPDANADAAQAVATMGQNAQSQSEEQQPESQTVAESETVSTTEAASETAISEETLPEVTTDLSSETGAEGVTQPEVQAVQADTTPQYYVVRKGDTLRTICFAFYGDYSHVDEICKWNNIEDPDNILYGQKLLLP
ncbi:MAG: LysM peptidoglycan-binding domain-containing protein [Lachnospiraceae bacterium]|nr:LysM peptidoglycan-binding domain-containing protein [Lachnospiraceae bacterium]